MYAGGTTHHMLSKNIRNDYSFTQRLFKHINHVELQIVLEAVSYCFQRMRKK